MKLHEWQASAVRRIILALQDHRRVVAVSPTGSGKTVVAAALIRDTLPSARVLWLAHRFELIEQAKSELQAAGVSGEQIGIMTGTVTENEDARILVSSVQMFHHRRIPHGVELIIIDEAHRSAAGTYKKILENTSAYVLGLTATPWRLDGKPLSESFHHMTIMETMSALEVDGYIAKPVTYGVSRKRARQITKGVKSGTDFNQTELGKAMASRPLMGDLVSEKIRLAPGLSTIVFCVNRMHGKAVAERFTAAGLTTEYLDGETRWLKRCGIVDRLRGRETEVVVNVDVLTEGFDCPVVGCVAIARPTKSLTRFLQYCGRGARIHDGTRPIILDHAGNCWRFGLPNAERSEFWSLTGRAKPHGGSGYPIIRRCPDCGAMFPVSFANCSECGAKLLTEKEIKEEAVMLEKIQATKAEEQRKREVLMKIGQSRGKRKDELSSWVERLLA